MEDRKFLVSLHSWQRGSNLTLLWRPPYCLTPFSNLPFPISLSPLTSTPIVFSVVLFLWLNGRSRHSWCAILLNDNMDLHMSSMYLRNRRTLMCVLCNKASSRLLRSDTCGFLLVLWFDITNTQTHTTHSGASRLAHPCKCIFTPLVICSKELLLGCC